MESQFNNSVKTKKIISYNHPIKLATFPGELRYFLPEEVTMAENLYDVFSDWARIKKNAPVFYEANKMITYSEFISQVDSLAAGLTAHGVEPGDRVCILALNSVAFLGLVVACAKTGAFAFPINWRLAAGEVEAVLSLAGPKVLIVEKEFIPLLVETELNAIPARFLMGDKKEENFTLFAELSGENETAPAVSGIEDPVAIISTAAVAGLPRGAMLKNRNFIGLGRQFKKTFELTESDCFLAGLPFFHIAGLAMTFAFSVVGGASVVEPRFNAKSSSKLIDSHHISMIATFPPMLEMMMKTKEESGATWETLRICWGILNPPEIVHAYQELDCGEYWTGYGQTETTGIVTLGNYSEMPGSAGKVVDALEMRITNEAGEEVPVGETGEIAARGDLIHAGYWRDVDYTNLTFRGGWHHTGDLGKVNEEGHLFFMGRKPDKELIKSGGENIYPAEVENAIRKLSEVADVCVIGTPSDEWGEMVVAVVEAAPGRTLNQAEILTGIESNLASYKKPQRIIFVESLPRRENGDVDRKAVKSSYGGE